MNRLSLINFLLQRTCSKSYLEIGIRRGETLCLVESPDKTGVDPCPQVENISPELSPFLQGIKIFNCTSDAFFADNKYFFDVVFIDGLHIYEQVLKDVSNSFRYLRSNGFIVLHDCCPTDAYSATREWHEGPWYGDVWKVPFHLHRDYSEIGCVIIDADCGLAVLWQKSSVPQLVADSEIVDLPFDFYQQERESFQHIVQPEDLNTVLPIYKRGIRQKSINLIKLFFE